jgi:hypothetical protein
MMIALARWIGSSRADGKTHRGAAAHSFPGVVHHGRPGVGRKVTTKDTKSTKKST